jgi:hypothetical protein
LKHTTSTKQDNPTKNEDSQMEPALKGKEPQALILNRKDNVAVALADLEADTDCLVMGDGGEKYFLTVLETIPFGHKLALVDLAGDEVVYKYGEEIGQMKVSVRRGGWIHSHNLYCRRGMK